MSARPPRRVLWAVAILLAYGGLVVIAYAVGPVVSSGCLIAAHGRITAANGDASSFSGLSATPPSRGAELYRDNGPKQAFRLRSLSVDAMTCTATASRATVAGKASIGGSGVLEYRVDLQLGASEHGHDSYRLRLSNGYDSGPQLLRHADIDIHAGSSEHRHRDSDAARNASGQPDGG